MTERRLALLSAYIVTSLGVTAVLQPQPLARAVAVVAIILWTRFSAAIVVRDSDDDLGGEH